MIGVIGTVLIATCNKGLLLQFCHEHDNLNNGGPATRKIETIDTELKTAVRD